MGASSSSSSSSLSPSSSQSSSSPSNAASHPRKIIPLYHPIILNGMPGSGRSTLQHALDLKDHRVLSIPVSFLTSPPIYTSNSRALLVQHDFSNTPQYQWQSSSTTDSTTSTTPSHDPTIFYFGGRSSYFTPRWTTVASNTSAIVFTLDATRRDTLMPKRDYLAKPPHFVRGYNNLSKEEQTEILQTLTQELTAKSMLHILLREPELRHLPLLIVVTHCDQPNAMSIQEIHDALNLSSLKRREWRLAGVDLLTGDGLQECVDWLNYTISVTPARGEGIKDWNVYVKENKLYNKKEEKRWIGGEDVEVEVEEDGAKPSADSPTPAAVSVTSAPPSSEVSVSAAPSTIAPSSDFPPSVVSTPRSSVDSNSRDAVDQQQDKPASSTSSVSSSISLSPPLTSLQSTSRALPTNIPVPSKPYRKHWYSSVKQVPLNDENIHIIVQEMMFGK